MNQSQIIKNLTDKNIDSKLNLDLYSLILKQIYSAANQGEYCIYLIFNNCNYKYLQPYERKLRMDGFKAIASFSPSQNDSFRMALHIWWN